MTPGDPKMDNKTSVRRTKLTEGEILFRFLGPVQQSEAKRANPGTDAWTFQVQPEIAREPMCPAFRFDLKRPSTPRNPVRALLSVWPFQAGLEMARHLCLLVRVWPFHCT